MPKKQSWGAGLQCLVVADGATREVVARALAAVGFAVKACAGEKAALGMLEREPFAAVLVEHRMGAAILPSLVAMAAKRHPEVPVIVIGATPTVDEAVDVMRRGATDYVPPPLEPAVLLLRVQKLIDQRGYSTEATAQPENSFQLFGLVGASAPMLRVYSVIDKVSRYKTNVLLLGESGTGKELIARALHARGPRRQRLFVPINCATLGRDLLENELFGHERGAFTGANERKKGLFELADGGTLFLDEIAEMDPSTQAKLLRVLERNEFRRVGGTEKVKVDLSIIAATNRNISGLIAEGRFREDLYYRLKVVTIVVPPLRERKEDIPALVDAFIADFNRRNGDRIKGVSPGMLRRIMAHDWPGNVRELKNAVESAAILAQGSTIDLDPSDAQTGNSGAARQDEQPGPVAGEDSATVVVPLAMTLADAERKIILGHLAKAPTRALAARSLGIGLRTLYTKLGEYEKKAR
jgi:DNA-binding NtrC family response regulator